MYHPVLSVGGPGPRRPHRHVPVLRRVGAERATIPILRRQDLAVEFLDRHTGTALSRRHVLEQPAEGVRAPDREERVHRGGAGAVTVAAPEAGHGRDVTGYQLAEGLRCQERVVGADDEPGGGRGEDVRGDEAGCGADDGDGIVGRRVVDGFHVLGYLVGAGEVQESGLGLIA